MAINGLDDLATKLSNGQQWSQDWFKLSGANAFVAGNAYDLSLYSGSPAANTYPGTALNSVVPTEATGWGMIHGGNVSADTKMILNALAYAVGANSAPGILRLVDVAMYYPGVDLRATTLQTMVHAASLTRHTTGRGLRAFIVTTVQSGGTPASTPVVGVRSTSRQARRPSPRSARSCIARQRPTTQARSCR